mmetsp:Transcript_6171/g.14749  ORF Transcript_6171/g.14749 Transcript_6171/m.14749 type:complete len:215 (+) Transcript_6171:70-714(+)
MGVAKRCIEPEIGSESEDSQECHSCDRPSEQTCARCKHAFCNGCTRPACAECNDDKVMCDNCGLLATHCSSCDACLCDDCAETCTGCGLKVCGHCSQADYTSRFEQRKCLSCAVAKRLPLFGRKTQPSPRSVHVETPRSQKPVARTLRRHETSPESPRLQLLLQHRGRWLSRSRSPIRSGSRLPVAQTPEKVLLPRKATAKQADIETMDMKELV